MGYDETNKLNKNNDHNNNNNCALSTYNDKCLIIIIDRCNDNGNYNSSNRNYLEREELHHIFVTKYCKVREKK
jgi:hypothetical protein